MLASFLLLLLGAVSAQASILDRLDETQRQSIEQKESVMTQKSMPGSEWPAVTLYQWIDAHPSECAAIFSDCEQHKDFFPFTQSSKISQRIAPTILEVVYTVGLSFFFKDRFTLKSRLTDYDGGQSYNIDWTLVQSNLLESAEGSIQFEPHQGGTLIAYQNFVVPKSGMAQLFKKQALELVQEVFSTFVAQVQSSKTKNPSQLKMQLEALALALEQARASSKECGDLLGPQP